MYCFLKVSTNTPLLAKSVEIFFRISPEVIFDLTREKKSLGTEKSASTFSWFPAIRLTARRFAPESIRWLQILINFHHSSVSVTARKNLVLRLWLSLFFWYMKIRQRTLPSIWSKRNEFRSGFSLKLRSSGPLVLGLTGGWLKGIDKVWL